MSESSFIDTLLERRAPTTKDFDVLLERGDIFTFSYPEDHAELNIVKRNASKLAKSWLEGKVHESWKPFMMDDLGTLVYVYLLSHRNTRVRLFDGYEEVSEGETKPRYVESGGLGHFEFLQMAKRWPYGFEALALALDNHLAVASVTAQLSALEETKKE